MTIERKTASSASLKELTDAGSGVAVFATMGVVDKDGDITERGAFGEQSAIVLPTHNWGHIPLGKARIFERDNEAIAEFQLFMDISAAKDWYHALKGDLEHGPGEIEWSYGFDVLDSGQGMVEGRRVRVLKKLKVHEVSPVVLGAGENTRTLAVKRMEHGPLKLSEEIRLVVAEVESAVQRAEEVSAMREGKGKELGEDARRGLESLLAPLKTCADRIQTLLKTAPAETVSGDLENELAKFQLFRRRISGGVVDIS